MSRRLGSMCMSGTHQHAAFDFSSDVLLPAEIAARIMTSENSRVWEVRGNLALAKKSTAKKPLSPALMQPLFSPEKLKI